MGNKRLEDNGTLEHEEKVRGKEYVEETVYLAEIICELQSVVEAYSPEYRVRVKENYERKFSRRFKTNLEKILGYDATELLKENSNYSIPKQSVEFVKRLIEPDDEMKDFIGKKKIPKEGEMFEKIDYDTIEEIVEYDICVANIRHEIIKLFGRCDDKSRKEVLKAFYEQYNPYYTQIMKGIDCLKEFIENMAISPYMDITSCRTINDDIIRCIQDIGYAKKRGLRYAVLQPKVVKSLKTLEYMAKME